MAAELQHRKNDQIDIEASGSTAIATYNAMLLLCEDYL
jgi:hypothetical protein